MSSNDTSTLHGGCHCGGLSVRLSVTPALSEIHPRACDCSFCCKHGAAWVSDPAGQLRIEAQESLLRSYRQGSESARFLVCGSCGVLVAVVLEHQATTYGAVNTRCLDGAPAFGDAVSVSPRLLGPSDKVARWQQVWIPDVDLVLIRA